MRKIKETKIKKIKKTPISGGQTSISGGWIQDFNNPNITLTRRRSKR